MKRPEDAVWNILVDEFLFNASLWRQKCQRAFSGGIQGKAKALLESWKKLKKCQRKKFKNPHPLKQVQKRPLKYKEQTMFFIESFRRIGTL